MSKKRKRHADKSWELCTPQDNRNQKKTKRSRTTASRDSISREERWRDDARCVGWVRDIFSLGDDCSQDIKDLLGTREEKLPDLSVLLETGRRRVGNHCTMMAHIIECVRSLQRRQAALSLTAKTGTDGTVLLSFGTFGLWLRDLMSAMADAASGLLRGVASPIAARFNPDFMDLKNHMDLGSVPAGFFASVICSCASRSVQQTKNLVDVVIQIVDILNRVERTSMRSLCLANCVRTLSQSSFCLERMVHHQSFLPRNGPMFVQHSILSSGMFLRWGLEVGPYATQMRSEAFKDTCLNTAKAHPERFLTWVSTWIRNVVNEPDCDPDDKVTTMNVIQDISCAILGVWDVVTDGSSTRHVTDIPATCFLQSLHFTYPPGSFQRHCDGETSERASRTMRSQERKQNQRDLDVTDTTRKTGLTGVLFECIHLCLKHGWQAALDLKTTLREEMKDLRELYPSQQADGGENDVLYLHHHNRIARQIHTLNLRKASDVFLSKLGKFMKFTAVWMLSTPFQCMLPETVIRSLQNVLDVATEIDVLTVHAACWFMESVQDHVKDRVVIIGLLNRVTDHLERCSRAMTAEDIMRTEADVRDKWSLPPLSERLLALIGSVKNCNVDTTRYCRRSMQQITTALLDLVMTTLCPPHHQTEDRKNRKKRISNHENKNSLLKRSVTTTSDDDDSFCRRSETTTADTKTRAFLRIQQCAFKPMLATQAVKRDRKELTTLVMSGIDAFLEDTDRALELSESITDNQDYLRKSGLTTVSSALRAMKAMLLSTSTRTTQAHASDICIQDSTEICLLWLSLNENSRLAFLPHHDTKERDSKTKQHVCVEDVTAEVVDLMESLLALAPDRCVQSCVVAGDEDIVASAYRCCTEGGLSTTICDFLARVMFRSSKIEQLPHPIPEKFIDIITQNVMRHPVHLGDGFTVDASTADRLRITQDNKSPFTRKNIVKTPDTALEAEIVAFFSSVSQFSVTSCK